MPRLYCTTSQLHCNNERRSLKLSCFVSKKALNVDLSTVISTNSILRLSTLFVFLFLCHGNDELSARCFALTDVNSAILSAHGLFETYSFRMHPNKSSLIESNCTKSPCELGLKGPLGTVSPHRSVQKERERLEMHSLSELSQRG